MCPCLNCSCFILFHLLSLQYGMVIHPAGSVECIRHTAPVLILIHDKPIFPPFKWMTIGHITTLDHGTHTIYIYMSVVLAAFPSTSPPQMVAPLVPHSKMQGCPKTQVVETECKTLNSKIKGRQHLASYRTTRSTVCSDEGRCLMSSHASWIRFVTQDIKIWGSHKRHWIRPSH